MAKKRIVKKTADRVLERLTEFAEAIENGATISERFTCRNVTFKLEPSDYTAKDVKRVRNDLALSQAVFAKYLGVSVKTLQSWEQGKKVPPIARRFLDEIERDPARVFERLKEATTAV